MFKNLSLVLVCIYSVVGIVWMYRHKDAPQGRVLSQRIEVTPSPSAVPIETIISETTIPKDSPQPTAVPTSGVSTPTIKPISTHLPTVTPALATPTPSTPTLTPTLLPTPSPTPTVTPSPSPTPSPTLTTFSTEQISGFYNQYAGIYGINADELRHIAKCESEFRPHAINPAGYAGLYQFGTAAWTTYRAKMGLSTNPDLRLNPEEAIKTTAFIMKQYPSLLKSLWPNCVP